MEHNGAQIGKNLSLTDLGYADDVGLLSNPEHAQKMLDDIIEWSSLIRLKVSADKTKFMVMNHPNQISLSVNLTQLERQLKNLLFFI